MTFTVSCSKGTYIRSLCAEAGEKLGCGGCMSALRRMRSGSFRVEEAISMEGMTAKEKRESLLSRVLPMTDLLPEMAVIDVDGPLAERLRNGCQPDGEALSQYHIPFLAAGDVVKFVLNDEHLVAVAQMLRGSDELVAGAEGKQAVRILRVFND